MVIKILGTGWPKCKELDKRVREVIEEMKVNVQIEHVTDIKKILEYPIMTTPGLVIDEKLVLSGKVPSKKEIETFISANLNK